MSGGLPGSTASFSSTPCIHHKNRQFVQLLYGGAGGSGNAGFKLGEQRARQSMSIFNNNQIPIEGSHPLKRKSGCVCVGDSHAGGGGGRGKGPTDKLLHSSQVGWELKIDNMGRKYPVLGYKNANFQKIV